MPMLPAVTQLVASLALATLALVEVESTALVSCGLQALKRCSSHHCVYCLAMQISMNVPTILSMTVISMLFVLTLLEASCALVMLALMEMGQCVTVSTQG